LRGSGASGVPSLKRRPEMKKALILLAVSSGLLLSACNTVRGAARDVESVGDCADGKPGNC
jgi:predicted small secreted protein